MNLDYPEYDLGQLAREVQLALNWMRRTKYPGVLFDNTYDLVSALEKHPMFKGLTKGHDAN